MKWNRRMFLAAAACSVALAAVPATGLAATSVSAVNTPAAGTAPSSGTTTNPLEPTANASGGCSDTTIASGNVERSPGGVLSWTTFGAGKGFSLSCTYYNNTAQARWYAETAPTYGSNHNQYGYVWVQRLHYGSTHRCDFYGDIFSIGSGPCTLIDYNPA
jgi:hypothetical protein